MILPTAPFIGMGLASEGSLAQAILLTTSEVIGLAETANQRELLCHF